MVQSDKVLQLDSGMKNHPTTQFPLGLNTATARYVKAVKEILSDSDPAEDMEHSDGRTISYVSEHTNPHDLLFPILEEGTNMDTEDMEIQSSLSSGSYAPIGFVMATIVANDQAVSEDEPSLADETEQDKASRRRRNADRQHRR